LPENKGKAGAFHSFASSVTQLVFEFLGATDWVPVECEVFVK